MVSLMQYRAAVGLHYIRLKAKECSDRMRGKFWSMLLFMFYMETLYLPTLKRVIHSWQMAYYARLWFTQMCLYRFYIPLLIRLANDVEMNPGPFQVVDPSKTVRADYHQGDVSLFGQNAGKQCVAMCLTAVVYSFKGNASWCRDLLNEILIQGNVLYSHISNSIGKDFLLLSEIPSALSINDEDFAINFSRSFAGDLHMSDVRDCYVPLQHALNMLIKDYVAFLLTIEINTVAIVIDNKGHYRIFDSHSRDTHGNLAVNGTAIVLEFKNVEEMVQHLQNFYKEKSLVPFEVLGVKVKSLSGNQSCKYANSCSLSFMSIDNAIKCNGSHDQVSDFHHVSDENGNHKRSLEQARINATSGQSQCHNLLELETESLSPQNVSDDNMYRKRKQTKSIEHKEGPLRMRDKKFRKEGVESEGKKETTCMSQKHRERYEKWKKSETKEQRENRLRKCREQRIKKKETESKEERENRLRKYMEQRIRKKERKLRAKNKEWTG